MTSGGQLIGPTCKCGRAVAIGCSGGSCPRCLETELDTWKNRALTAFNEGADWKDDTWDKRLQQVWDMRHDRDAAVSQVGELSRELEEVHAALVTGVSFVPPLAAHAARIMRDRGEAVARILDLQWSIFSHCIDMKEEWKLPSISDQHEACVYLEELGLLEKNKNMLWWKRLDAGEGKS